MQRVQKKSSCGVYFLLNLDEIIKLPAVFRRFYKYRWVRNLTAEGSM